MADNNYYRQQLNAQKLFQAYDTAIARVRGYLAAEIAFVRDNLTGTERVLELGAGYGRIIKELAGSCQSILGLDIAAESVSLAQEYLRDHANAKVIEMDVHHLALDQRFDVVLCLQNGLSAMKVMSGNTIERILDVTESGGRICFSTYSEKFWEHRLMWFQEQAEKGLLGELDLEQTRDGVIVCKDGFRAITHSPEDLSRIGDLSGYEYELREVDESSLFLIIHKP